MMKLFERHDQETHETLPDVPEGVTVPDDLSGLDTTDGHRGGTRVRWLRWAAPVALVAGGALVAAVVINDNGTETTDVGTRNATELVQQAIDDAVAELDATATTPTAAEMVQQAIDDAVAELDATATTPTAAEMVQQAIDDALAEL